MERKSYKVEQPMGSFISFCVKKLFVSLAKCCHNFGEISLSSCDFKEEYKERPYCFLGWSKTDKVYDNVDACWEWQ